MRIRRHDPCSAKHGSENAVLGVCVEFIGRSEFALRAGCAKFDIRIESFGHRLICWPKCS